MSNGPTHRPEPTPAPSGAIPGGSTGRAGGSVRPEPTPAQLPPVTKETVRVITTTAGREIAKIGKVGAASEFEPLGLEPGERAIRQSVFTVLAPAGATRAGIRSAALQGAADRRIQGQKPKPPPQEERPPKQTGYDLTKPTAIGTDIYKVAAAGEVTRKLIEREAAYAYATGLRGTVAQEEINKAPDVRERKRAGLKTLEKDISASGEYIFKSAVAAAAPSLADISRFKKQQPSPPPFIKIREATAEQTLAAQRGGALALGGAVETAVTFAPGIPFTIGAITKRPLETAEGAVTFAVAQPERFVGGLVASSAITGGLSKVFGMVRAKLQPKNIEAPRTVLIEPKPRPDAAVTYGVEDVVTLRGQGLVLESGMITAETAPKGLTAPQTIRTLAGEKITVRLPKGLKTIKENIVFETSTQEIGGKFVSDISAARAITTPSRTAKTGFIADAITKEPKPGVLKTTIRGLEVKPGAGYGPGKLPAAEALGRKLTTILPDEAFGIEKITAESSAQKIIPFRGQLAKTVETGQRKLEALAERGSATFERRLFGEISEAQKIKTTPFQKVARIDRAAQRQLPQAELAFKPLGPFEPAAGQALRRQAVLLEAPTKIEAAARAARPLPKTMPKTAAAPAGIRVTPISEFAAAPKQATAGALSGAVVLSPFLAAGPPARLSGLIQKAQEPPGRFAGGIVMPSEKPLIDAQTKTLAQTSAQAQTQLQKDLTNQRVAQPALTAMRAARGRRIAQAPFEKQVQELNQEQLLMTRQMPAQAQRARQRLEERQLERQFPLPGPAFQQGFPRARAGPGFGFRRVPFFFGAEAQKPSGRKKKQKPAGSFRFGVRTTRFARPADVAALSFRPRLEGVTSATYERKARLPKFKIAKPIKVLGII